MYLFVSFNDYAPVFIKYPLLYWALKKQNQLTEIDTQKLSVYYKVSINKQKGKCI